MRRVGLTLIEVVVALALGVVLVVGVQTLTVRAHHAARHLRAQEASTRRTEALHDLIRTDLLSMPSVGNMAVRDGELQVTTLNNLEPDSSRTRQTVSVRYRAVENTGSYPLERAQRNARQEQWPAGAVLAPYVQAVTFDVHDGRSWQTGWPPQTLSRPAGGFRSPANS